MLKTFLSTFYSAALPLAMVCNYRLLKRKTRTEDDENSVEEDEERMHVKVYDKFILNNACNAFMPSNIDNNDKDCMRHK